VKLGLDWYTLRWQGWDAFQFIDYCADLGLDSLQLSARRHFASLDETDLRPVRERADARGILLELGHGTVNKHATSFRADEGSAEEQLSRSLRAAKLLGAPHVHVVLGGVPERRLSVSIDEQIAECVRVSKAVEPLARELGIKLAFENHGDLLARELLALVEAAGPDFVGVCLDTGNPATMAEDPLMAVELLAPHALTGHVRDSRVWAVPEGAMLQFVPMGQGSHDFARAVAILKEQAPGMCFDLETLGGREPRLIPYLDETSDFWDAFPKIPFPRPGTAGSARAARAALRRRGRRQGGPAAARALRGERALLPRGARPGGALKAQNVIDQAQPAR
jgi:sugar phosphate isomerase/epimerase